MLGWIPFRVTGVAAMLQYFEKIITPHAYTFLGMRENNYVITFLILLLIVAAYLLTTYIKPRLENKLIGQVAHVATLSVAVALVIIFLRPISQFIYFQF